MENIFPKNPTYTKKDYATALKNKDFKIVIGCREQFSPDTLLDLDDGEGETWTPQAYLQQNINDEGFTSLQNAIFLAVGRRNYPFTNFDLAEMKYIIDNFGGNNADELEAIIKDSKSSCHNVLEECKQQLESKNFDNLKENEIKFIAKYFKEKCSSWEIVARCIKEQNKDQKNYLELLQKGLFKEIMKYTMDFQENIDFLDKNICLEVPKNKNMSGRQCEIVLILVSVLMEQQKNKEARFPFFNYAAIEDIIDFFEKDFSDWPIVQEAKQQKTDLEVLANLFESDYVDVSKLIPFCLAWDTSRIVNEYGQTVTQLIEQNNQKFFIKMDYTRCQLLCGTEKNELSPEEWLLVIAKVPDLKNQAKNNLFNRLKLDINKFKPEQLRKLITFADSINFDQKQACVDRIKYLVQYEDGCKKDDFIAQINFRIEVGSDFDKIKVNDNKQKAIYQKIFSTADDKLTMEDFISLLKIENLQQLTLAAKQKVMKRLFFTVSECSYSKLTQILAFAGTIDFENKKDCLTYEKRWENLFQAIALGDFAQILNCRVEFGNDSWSEISSNRISKIVAYSNKIDEKAKQYFASLFCDKELSLDAFLFFSAQTSLTDKAKEQVLKKYPENTPIADAKFTEGQLNQLQNFVGQLFFQPLQKYLDDLKNKDELKKQAEKKILIYNVPVRQDSKKSEIFKLSEKQLPDKNQESSKENNLVFENLGVIEQQEEMNNKTNLFDAIATGKKICTWIYDYPVNKNLLFYGFELSVELVENKIKSKFLSQAEKAYYLIVKAMFLLLKGENLVNLKSALGEVLENTGCLEEKEIIVALLQLDRWLLLSEKILLPNVDKFEAITGCIEELERKIEQPLQQDKLPIIENSKIPRNNDNDNALKKEEYKENNETIDQNIYWQDSYQKMNYGSMFKLKTIKPTKNPQLTEKEYAEKTESKGGFWILPDDVNFTKKNIAEWKLSYKERLEYLRQQHELNNIKNDNNSKPIIRRGPG